MATKKKEKQEKKEKTTEVVEKEVERPELK